MLTTVADVREVERRMHTLVGVAEIRAPEGGAWYPLFVRSGSVSLSALGNMPCRTCSVEALTWTSQLPDVFDVLSVLGSWIRLTHRVTRVDGTSFDVPLGYYRVSQVEPHYLDGTVTITGEDAGSLVRDYGLTTLGEGQVLVSQAYRDVAAAMVNATLSGIPSWWQMQTDTGGAPATKPVARLQYEGSRVDAVAALLRSLGMAVRFPLDNTAVFRFVTPQSQAAPGVITIRGGELGNLVDVFSSQDRQGIANVALVKYTTETTAPGVRQITSQRRLIEQYTQADSDVRAGGPFGKVTLDVSATSVTTDSAAQAAADQALADTLTQARDFDVTCSPIYGLEAGDVVRVETSEGTGQRGIVVGGSIGLTAQDSWSLTIRAFNSVGRWGKSPRRTFVTDARDVRDNADWQDLAAATVDLTGNSTKGWTATAASLTGGGASIVVKATGAAGEKVQSAAAWAWPSSQRIRVRFTVSAPDAAAYIRAYVLTGGVQLYSKDWVVVGVGRTATFEADITKTGIIGQAFAVGILAAKDKAGTALAANVRLRVSEVDLAAAKVSS